MTLTQINSSVWIVPNTPTTSKKLVFISWLKNDARSNLLAKHVGADLYYVKWGARKWYLAPLRYIVQSFLTWPILMREKPDVVFLQLPPIFCGPVTFLYARLFGKQYILDTHSGSFMTKIGRATQWLHKFLSRNALVTLVHNSDIEQVVKAWDVPVLLLGYTPDDYPQGAAFEFSDKFNVVFICTFSPDEPVGEVIEAARQLPDCHVYITGNYNRAPQHLENKPDNVTFTGYIDHDVFIGLLRGGDALMDLTTRDNTVLMGGFEAITLDQPLITSDTPILRSYFNRGTVYVDNTAAGIAAGIREAQENLEQLQTDIQALHTDMDAEWDRDFATLQKLIEGEISL
ncbi:MAG: glycosyltransferase [Anaerolineae bacterium]|nr:glycosyltransferase [Anaerolineae bacterium]